MKTEILKVNSHSTLAGANTSSLRTRPSHRVLQIGFKLDELTAQNYKAPMETIHHAGRPNGQHHQAWNFSYLSSLMTVKYTCLE